MFDNLLQQDFTATKVNQKWCTDFTYLLLTDGGFRYNCSVLDLHDRSILASITDKNITSDHGIRTVQKTHASQSKISADLILNSDQGSQYTPKSFTQFCQSVGITQSMSKAGYPYDNAPMKRYYNTLKNEQIHLHDYHTEDEWKVAVENFAHI